MYTIISKKEPEDMFWFNDSGIYPFVWLSVENFKRKARVHRYWDPLVKCKGYEDPESVYGWYVVFFSNSSLIHKDYLTYDY